MNASNQISLFYSYAHADTALRDKLDKHLSSLRRGGFITQWYDRNINTGTEWANQIDQHLNTAHIILLLISSNFLASDYCYSVEMNRALERHRIGEARVIPVLLRHVDWQHAPFAELEVLPQGARPVTNWSDQDLAFRNIALKLREVVEELQALQMNTSLYREEVIQSNNPYNPQRDRINDNPDRNVQQDYMLPHTPQAFAQFRHCQEKVSELKNIHNMLHEIEVALEGLAATVQLVMRSERGEQNSSRKRFVPLNEGTNQHFPNFNYIEIIWRQTILKMDHLTYFAAKEMKALEDEHFSFDNDVIRGASWVKDLFILQRSFEIGVGDRNIDAIEKLSDELLTKCRSHLYHIDKRLLGAVKELDLASDLIVRHRT